MEVEVPAGQRLAAAVVIDYFGMTGEIGMDCRGGVDGQNDLLRALRIHFYCL